MNRNKTLFSFRRVNSPALLLLLALSVFSVVGCDDDDECPTVDPAPGGSSSLTIAVFSDPHLYDTTLGTSGDAFQEYLAEDRKLIRESELILREVVDEIKASKAEVVLVAGDLTKDGEHACHNKMALYLAELEAAGKRVFVIPGNHDVNNLHGARSYSEAGASPIPTVSSDQFKSIYSQYGYAEAIAIDPNSLSYTVKLADNLWLVVMDACRYDENTESTTFTGGKLTTDKLNWIKAQLHLAKAQGITVFGMMHQGLMEHYTGQTQLFADYVVEDWQTLHKTLADSGMKAVFTGHFHSNDIVKGSGTGSGKFIYDIETGSTVTYPCPYRMVTVNKEDNAFSTLSVQTNRITNVSGNFGGKTFAQYAQEYLKNGLNGIITVMLTSMYGLSAQDAQFPAQLLTDAMMAHYAGDENPSSETLGYINALLQNPSATYQTLGMMLTSLWTDLAPTDNNLVIDLKTGAIK